MCEKRKPQFPPELHSIYQFPDSPVPDPPVRTHRLPTQSGPMPSSPANIKLSPSHAQSSGYLSSETSPSVIQMLIRATSPRRPFGPGLRTEAAKAAHCAATGEFPFTGRCCCLKGASHGHQRGGAFGTLLFIILTARPTSPPPLPPRRLLASFHVRIRL
jgi:hypothetical protein